MGQGRIGELDGLRGVAILIVMTAHFTHGRMAPGGFGVTLFFVISGYIITRLLLRENRARGAIDIAGFYGRRLLRLTPALAAAVAAIALATLAVGHDVKSAPVLASLFYVKNYQGLFFRDEIAPPLAFLGIYWSLAVEQHFYLLLPPLFLWLRNRPRAFAAALIGLMAAILLWRTALVFQFGAPEARTYAATDTRIDSLFAGVLLALVASRVKTAATGVLPFGLGLALIAVCFLFDAPAQRETIRYTLQNAGIALAMFAVLHGTVLGPLRAVLSQGFLHFTGTISYSLYLWHLLCLYFAERMLGPSPLTPIAGAVLSYAVAWLSWKAFEQAPQKLRGRWKRPASEDKLPAPPPGRALLR